MRSVTVFCLLVLGLGLMATPAVAQQDWEAAPLGWQPFTAVGTVSVDQGKKVLVDIYAPWCGWCRRMHQEVYTDEAVRAYLADHFILTRLDNSNEADRVTYKTYDLSEAELAYGFGATGTPTTVFLAPSGDYITRLPGFADAETFLQILQFIATDAYVDQTFDAWSSAGR